MFVLGSDDTDHLYFMDTEVINQLLNLNDGPCRHEKLSLSLYDDKIQV